MDYHFEEAANEEQFTERTVSFLSEYIQAVSEERGVCTLGLSGGSTPKAVYTELGKQPLDWSRVLLFLVDERYTAPDSKESNQKLVRDTLLANADIPEENLFFPNTTVSLESCLAGYIQSLIELFNEQPPDIITLGLGEDGHIASLFPPVPEHAFGEVLALHTTTDAFAIHDRITVSPLIIMAAQAQLLMMRGEKKKHLFGEIVDSGMDPVRWPLQVALATGKTTVMYAE